MDLTFIWAGGDTAAPSWQPARPPAGTFQQGPLCLLLPAATEDFKGQ